jgi:hypothetical protein
LSPIFWIGGERRRPIAARHRLAHAPFVQAVVVGEAGTCVRRRAESGSYEATVHSAAWYSTRPRSASVKSQRLAYFGSCVSTGIGTDFARRARPCEAIIRLRGVFGHVSARSLHRIEERA